MTDFILQAFTVLVVVIDPVGIAPLYLALTLGASGAERRRMALRGVLLAVAILFVFALAGTHLLRALGVSLAAFRIAGGLLFFLIAVDMLLARPSGLSSTTGEEQAEARQFPDISVFPLAIPLLAGPGAMTSVVLLMGRAAGDPVKVLLLLGVLGFVLLLSLMALLAAGPLSRLLGVTGSNVVGRVLGIVLAALAVQYVLDGLADVGLLG